MGNLLSITRSTGGLTAPAITNIVPNSARAGDEVTVTISGTHLTGAGVSINNPEVNISNVHATETSITATFSLSYFAVLGPATITVSNGLGSAQTGFTIDPPPPTLTAVSPASGPITRLVQLSGTGFDSTPANNLVKFNGVAAPVYSATPFVLKTSVPTGATTGPITVTAHGMTSNGLTFTIVSAGGPPPAIAAVSPNVGSVEGGSSVTITGSGFTSQTKALICGEPVAGSALVDAATLRITTAPGTAGVCDVMVTNENGDAFLPAGFTYLAGPPQKIVNISPTMGLTTIPTNSPISVLFARPLDRASVTGASFSLVATSSTTPVAGSFSFDFGDTVAVFTPAANFSANTSYTLAIKRDIKSIEGIPLDLPFSGSFTTGSSPDTVPPRFR